MIHTISNKPAHEFWQWFNCRC